MARVLLLLMPPNPSLNADVPRAAASTVRAAG
jgi:hypothetical protein